MRLESEMMKGNRGGGRRTTRPAVAKLACLAAAAACALAVAFTERAMDVNAQEKKINARPAASPTPAPEPFDGASPEKMAGQCVKLVTEAGEIEIEMLAEVAPENARNFLNLAATGMYDTTTFARVVKDFVIQGGNLSTGEKWNVETARRASRKVPDEPSQVKHERGIVSMARPDEPNSGTTHFFILVGNATQLDGKFSAFGRVRRGMEVVDAINKAPAEGEKPQKPVRISKAVVSQCQAPG